MQQNHYEVLGLPMSATPEQIRKRYRELVRRYHPDVNPAPDAKEQFLRVQEAYQVLSDPERRRHYDALLRLQTRSASPSTPRQSAQQGPTSRASQPGPTRPPDASGEARRAIFEAERAFLQGRLRDALHWARQATRLQPRHPQGYIIMGDVYRMQGHLDAALNAYTYALQLDPNNADLQRKFERLASMARATAPPAAPMRRVNLPVLLLPAEWRLYAGQSLGWGTVLFLIALSATMPGEPAALFRGLPVIAVWSFNLMLYLGLAGFLAGFLLSVSRWVAPLEDVLPWRRHGAQLSMGSVLVLMAALCFPLTALLYTLYGLLQGGLNSSVSRAFSVVGVLTLLFGLAYPHDTLNTLLFGGNLLFLGHLMGWYLGDSFQRG
ncbi:MAG: DnaJ domain-containing protein [Fimbriimonadales bacterium]|nr:DnaJ domain-containing protein [Fimbriimonadales bacterium]